jgi:hypothetical protein
VRFALALLLLAPVIGCKDPTPAPAAPPASSPAPPLASAPAPPPAASGTPSAAADAASEAAEPPEPVLADAGHPAPVGGNWLRCYAHFQPRTDPNLDVMRLGMMCGPSNGMKKASADKDVELPAGGGAREHRWQAEAGDCYRIFAVGEPTIEDLDIEVLDPAGKRIAFDTSDDRWPIVKPDGAFCVFQPGPYRAVVRAQRGAGKYAIEIWRLR